MRRRDPGLTEVVWKRRPIAAAYVLFIWFIGSTYFVAPSVLSGEVLGGRYIHVSDEELDRLVP